MKIKNIESDSNSVYKKLLTLSKSRGINKENECLIGGDKIIREVLAENTVNLEGAYWVYHTEEHELFEEKNAPDTLVKIAKSLFNEVDVVGVHSPLLCIPVPEVQEWKANEEVELLCGLGDPNNLGAMMRSAEAFGIKNLVLLSESCHPFHPKVIKSSAGSCFRLNLSNGPSIKELQDVRHLYALDGAGLPLEKVKFTKNAKILLGEEGQGIPNDLKVQKVSIPINPAVESLNATVAASILFYELSKDKK